MKKIFFLLVFFVAWLTPNSFVFADTTKIDVTAVSITQYNSWINMDIAKEIALSQSRVRAMKSASTDLSNIQDIRLIIEQIKATNEYFPHMLVLSYILMDLTTIKVVQQQSDDGDNIFKNGSVLAEISVSLDVNKNTRLTLLDFLARPELVDDYTIAVQNEESLVKAYDEGWRAFQDALKNKNIYSESSDADKYEIAFDESLVRLKQICNKLVANRICIDLLPSIYSEAKTDLQARQVKLELATTLDPENYVLLSALGRTYIQLNQYSMARNVINKSLKINDEYAPAYCYRAVIMLLDHYPAMALSDYSRAIALKPGRGDYYYSRAIAYRALGDTVAMCGDFQTACSFGRCSGEEWFEEEGNCTNLNK